MGERQRIIRGDAKAQLPAKRTDGLKAARVTQFVGMACSGQLTVEQARREILAIFGYEVEA